LTPKEPNEDGVISSAGYGTLEEGETPGAPSNIEEPRRSVKTI